MLTARDRLTWAGRRRLLPPASLPPSRRSPPQAASQWRPSRPLPPARASAAAAGAYPCDSRARAGSRRSLQEPGEIDMIGAEAHAVFAQGRARGLVEILHLGGNFCALQHAERLDQLERDAAPDAGDVLGLGEPEQRPQQLLDMRLQPQIEP